MSLKSKVTVGSAFGLTAGVILWVHYQQKTDKDKMHAGVLRDVERQKKKAENLYWLQQQIDFAKAMKKKEEEDMVLHQISESAKPADES